MPKEGPPQASSIDVWMVDDNPDYCETIRYLLQQTADLRSTGTFSSYEAFEAALVHRADRPDVVLMGVGLGGPDGVEGVRRLRVRLPGVAVVLLTIQGKTDNLLAALRAGASGYLLKETPLDEIVSALRAAARGGTYLPAPVAARMLQLLQLPSGPQDYALTERERDVLRLMCRGFTQKQIASDLAISTHTVDNHVRKIYQKLHVNSGLEAVAKALQEKIV